MPTHTHDQDESSFPSCKRPYDDEYRHLVVQEAVDRRIEGLNLPAYIRMSLRLEEIEAIDPYLRSKETDREYAALCGMVEDLQQRYPLPGEAVRTSVEAA